jgi:hypothetical protein
MAEIIRPEFGRPKGAEFRAAQARHIADLVGSLLLRAVNTGADLEALAEYLLEAVCELEEVLDDTPEATVIQNVREYFSDPNRPSALTRVSDYEMARTP